MGIDWNEISSNANGGTELLGRRLEASLPKDLLDQFQIILSRPRELDESKYRVLWLHDLPHDPESKKALSNGGWKKYHKLVFVSYWQREWYIREYGIPYSRTAVLLNAIYPIEEAKKDDPNTQINLVYHTSPHRGLDILYPVFNKLYETNKKIHLDVYSSFEMYGWKERDEHFKDLFEKIKNHPGMTYHGYKPNDDIRKALQKAHIFAYPNTWMETSCLSLIEAMSAKCVCVHPDFAALPETSSNWTFMYGFNEDREKHASLFYGMLEHAIKAVQDNEEGLNMKLQGAKNYIDVYYNWTIRATQWEFLLTSLLGLPKEFEKEEVFVYRA